MSIKRATAGAPALSGPPVLPRANVSVEHFQILLQRFESLVSSIVALKEEIAMVPGMDEWPAILHRYTNLLSHAYSLSSSLVSASPHFLPSQLALFNKILESEAKDSNLYASDATATTLFSAPVGQTTKFADGVRATADGLPELSFYDANNPLSLLLVHPVLPIAEDKLNFLGALLRTAPEPNITQEEAELVSRYDATYDLDEDFKEHADVDQHLQRVENEILEHDILAQRALRIWYHVEQATDEDGNILNLKERLPRDEDQDDNEGDDDDDDDDDEDMDEEEAALQKASKERSYRRKMDESTYSADRVSAFLYGHGLRN